VIVEFLVQFHSFWRWVVLIAAVVALVVVVGGWLGSLSLPLSARRAGLLYIVALDVQLLTGIILWVGRGWYATPGYFRFEHTSTMLLAVIVAHVGQAMAKRASDPRGAARTLAIAIAVSLVLVIVGIPGVVRGR
jgi:hypothetical protein